MSVKKYLSILEDLTGQKIIVTGGTSGIGLSIVKELLIKGADVVVLARNMAKANEVKSQLDELYPNKTTIVQYDQSNDESVINAANNIIKEHSDFTSLILNAGTFQSKNKQSTVDDMSLTIKTNLVGLNVFLNHLLPLMKSSYLERHLISLVQFLPLC